MKRSILTILVIIFLLPLISGCASIFPYNAGNYPAPRKHIIPVSQQTYPDEILVMPDFKVSKGEWFDPARFEAWLVAKSSGGINSAVQSALTKTLLSKKPVQVQMCEEISEGKSAFYTLNFWINHGVDINFQSKGLIMTFKNTEGHTVEVQDQGCLFLWAKDMDRFLRDSARGNVRFNRDFNNRPDYSQKRANFICVRLDPQYENWDLIALELDSQKIFVIH